MRALSVVILTILCTYVTFAQKIVNKKINVNANQEVNFDFDRANVKFTTWNKNEISITGTAKINNGENDDAFTMEVREIDGEWNISTFLENECQLPKMISMTKDGVTTYKKVEKKNGNWNGWNNVTSDGDSYDYVNVGIIAEIQLEIKIPKSIDMNIKSKFGDIDIEKFEGSLFAKSTHGHIEVVFAKAPRRDVELISTHNFVDVSVPSDSKLDVELRSSHGEILTDLDLDFQEGYGGQSSRKKKKSCGNYSKKTVVANLNGGGAELALKSTHDKIYLREYKVNN